VRPLEIAFRHTAPDQSNLCITPSQAFSDPRRAVARATLLEWEAEDPDGMRAGGHRRMSWDCTRRITGSRPTASVTRASTRANCTSHSDSKCWAPTSRSPRWPHGCGAAAAECGARVWKRAIGVRRETGGRGCVIGLGRVMECRGVWAPLSDLRAVEDIPRNCSFFFCELENEARVRGDRVLRGGSGRFATIFDTAMRQRRPTTPAGSFRGSSLIERPVSPGPGGTIGDAPSV
jgi:hypothetical protein